MSEPIWRPDPAAIESCELSRFARAVADHTGGVRAPDYPALWRWSVDDPERFWPAVVRHCKLKLSPPQAVQVRGKRFQDTRWFVGSRLNFAENLLAAVDDAREVLIGRDERGRRRVWSGAALRRDVERIAAGLAADGIGPGDRVAGFLPNTPEAVIAMLATARLGAVWTSCSPDFGFDGVLDRFGQVEPTVLFACDGYHYGGKRIDTRERVERLAQALPGLRRRVAVGFLGDDGPAMAGAVDFGDYGQGAAVPGFAAVAFDAPLYILYSSGTTGKPKCIVHGVGGTLLQHAKELVLHSDLRAGDTLFFFTTCGWMMWNWLVSGLVAGAALVLYDGSPFHPGPQALWELAEAEGVSHFGISPRYLAALEQAEYRPRNEHALGRLRTVFSTGAPLPPAAFDFVAESVGDVQLASISGGTDIISCFALGNPWQPVYRGELQGPGLGMAVDVFNATGRPLADGAGELVCTQPFPSMPVGFWNDADGSRYHRAYFERFAGVWHHGDFARRTEHGGFVILGRSDATLNPGGVRIGTAEIYRVVEGLDAVREAAAVGYRHDGDEHVILFVVLADGQVLDAEQEQAIRRAIREQLTPRHVPARVIPAPELPRTISGKLSEIAIRELIHGRELGNADALANPGSLAFFRELGRGRLL